MEGDWASDTDEGVIQVSCVVWLCLVCLWHKACVGETVQSWTNLFVASVVSTENTNKDHTKEHRCTTYYTD